jgi:phospholipid/cholesterol/gamma-HCH transport system permease protein
VEQLDIIGIGSMTVGLLTGAFTGMVLTMQSGMRLDQFGARSIVGQFVSASMAREKARRLRNLTRRPSGL